MARRGEAPDRLIHRVPLTHPIQECGGMECGSKALRMSGHHRMGHSRTCRSNKRHLFQRQSRDFFHKPVWRASFSGCRVVEKEGRGGHRLRTFFLPRKPRTSSHKDGQCTYRRAHRRNTRPEIMQPTQLDTQKSDMPHARNFKLLRKLKTGDRESGEGTQAGAEPPYASGTIR